MLRKLLIGSFSLFAMFALAGAALFLQTDSASAQIVEPGSAEVEAGPTTFRRGGNRGSILTREEKAEVVAGVLGISVDELAEAKEAGADMEELAETYGTTTDAISDAIYSATVAKVNEMVANEELTQEEADAILARLELKQLYSDIVDEDVLTQAAADAIGISVEEMEAAKEDGTLRDIMEENEVTRQDVREAVEDAKNQLIDEALANGEITEEQAEQLRDQGNGRNGRGGNGRGERGGDNGADDATDEDTVDA